MSMKELLSQLAKKGVHVSFAEEKLSVKAEKGAMTPEIMAQLKQNKPALLAFFKSSQSVKKSAKVSIMPAPQAQAYPLSPAQQRLWLTEQVYGASSTYHMPLVTKLKGHVDPQRLEWAISQVIEKHQVLRTFYQEKDESVMQVVDENHQFNLLVKQVTLPETELVAQVEQWVNTPFELQTQWPVRFELWQVNQDEYVLLGCAHHIACDGWSLGILLSDLAQAYNHQSQLAPLPLQYKDYAYWLNTNQAEQTELAFWQSYLADAPLVHTLPTINDEAARLEPVGKKQIKRLDEQVASGIEQVCKILQMTPFVFYRSAFALLVSRLSRQDDVVLGSPEAGRSASHLESLIGFFINTLVFRHKFDNGELTVGEWLKQEQEATLEVFEHKHMPFDSLVSKLAIDREHRYNPIFQLMFSFQNTPSSEVSFDGFETHPFAGEHNVAKFDITLDIVKGKQGFFSHWEYNQSLFKPDVVETMVECYHSLLETLLNSLNEPLKNIAVSALEPVEQPEFVIPKQDFITQIFANDAHKHALSSDDEAMTYGRLRQKVESLSAHLSKLTPAQNIAIWQPRGVEYVVSLLAIMHAGHFAVPLDRGLSDARLAHILDDAQINTVVGEGIENWPDAEVINPNEVKAHSVGSISQSELGGYIIYTSGSTGKPKGVQVAAKALTFHLASLAQRFASLTDKHILHFTNLSVDTAFEQLFLGLVEGANIYLKPDELWDTAQFWQAVLTRNIQVTDLPPSYLLTLLADDHSAQQFKQSKLEHIVLGGEAFPQKVSDYWHTNNLWQQIQLWNAYGPTEATITATFENITSDMSAPVPLGQLLAGRSAQVVDQYGHMQPAQFPGELLLGGLGLANGYLYQPELTQSRFINTTSGRFYKTGDLVYQDNQANIHFLGRTDHQVKVRGFRVELQEIEHVLASFSGIETAAVIYKPQTGTLAAFYSGNERASRDIQGDLSAQLPSYMVPKTITHLATWPLLDNGKINRKALAALELEQSNATADLVIEKPETAQEQDLVTVWQNVLGLSAVPLQESFFALGGDSISAIKTVSELSKLGWKLTAKDIFVEQTVSRLALCLKPIDEAQAYKAITGELALLPIQQSFIAEQNEHWTHFNQVATLELKQDMQTEHLLHALAPLVEQHDVLRMVLTAEEQLIQAQFLAADMNYTQLVFDYQVDSLNSQTWLEIVNSHQAQFEVNEQPLWCLLRVNESSSDKVFLVWICHHFIVDSVSWQVLLSDFASSLQAQNQQLSPVLASKTAPISVWFDKLAAWSDGIDESTQTYWQSQVNDFNALCDDNAAHSVVGDTQVRKGHLLGPQINQFLQLGQSKLAMTEQELLLALFASTLSLESNKTQLPFVMEHQGRLAHDALVDVSRTLGWFTATYPFVSAFKQADINELVALKEQFRAVPDNGVSFSVLQRFKPSLNLEWDTTQAICFNYLGRQNGGQVESNEAPFSPAAIPVGTNQSALLKRSFALAINCNLHVEGLDYAMDYGSNYADSAMLQDFNQRLENQLTHWVQLLASQDKLYTASDFPLADLSTDTMQAINQKYADIEAIYPATPMQKGMVFHALMDEIDVYVPQSHVTFNGPFDLATFKQAWQRVIAHHEVLRSSFFVETGDVFQLIFERMEMPIYQMTPSEINHDIEAYKTSVQRLGFDLMSAPLMRLDIIHRDSQFDVIWTHHHSILDGWSVPVIFNELLGHYFTLLNGSSAAIAAPKQPYREYVKWFTQQSPEQAVDFWQQQLSPLDGKTDMGLKPHAAKPEQAYFIDNLSLNKQTTDALSTFAKQCNVTLSTLIQGSWAWLLARYSGNTQVCFGTTVSGRPEEVAGASEMVGLFINSLPIVTDTQAEQTTAQWLQRLQLTINTAEQNGFIPLSDIAASVNKTGAELFDTLVIYENYPSDIADGEGPGETDLTITKHGTQEWTNYPLTLMIGQSDAIHIRAILDAKYQSQPWFKQLCTQWHSLLTRLATGQWQALSDWHSHDVKAVDNTTKIPESLPHALLSQLQSLGAKSCVMCDGQIMSYAQVLDQSQRIAGYLHDNGVSRVGLHLKRTPYLLSSILACVISGVTFVPMDPAFPNERLQAIAAQAELDLVLSDSPETLNAPQQTVMYMHALPKKEHVLSAKTGNFSAYMMFTSGSTGKPKGVPISIDALSRFMQSSNEVVSLQSNAHVLATTTYAFDISLLELLLPIYTGSTLILACDNTHKDPFALCELLDAHPEIQLAQGTPSFWRMLFNSRHDINLKGKTLLCGGEALTPELAQQLLAQDARVINCYGPTEATIWSMMGEVTHSDNLNLSHTLSGYQHYVLNEQNKVLAPGMLGELCIASSALSDGYWQNEALTDEKFFIHPELKIRLYRTGDLVRQVGEDSYEFLGRKDDQVKLRGYRIELGEIESQLCSITDISEAAVVVNTQQGEQTLVAYYVAHQALDASEISEVLSGALPYYMVPQHFECLEYMPKNNNGKVDKKRLPKVQIASTSFELVAPKTSLERKLQKIWQQVLSINLEFGVTQSFYDLGGNSLSLVALLASLRSQLDVQIDLSELAGNLTIRTLAVSLEQNKDADPVLLPLVKTGAQRTLFLLPPASGYWENPDIFAGVKTERTDVYGVQLGELLVSHNVEEIVSQLANKIAQCPTEVVLGAYSMGGMWLPKLLHALADLNKQVGHIVLLDCGHQSHFKAGNLTEQIAQFLAVVKDKSHAHYQVMKSRLAGVEHITQVEALYQNAPDAIEQEVLKRLLAMVKHSECISDLVNTNVFEQKTTYIAASTTAKNDEHVQAWQSQLPNFKRLNVKGDHSSMLEIPNNLNLFNKLEQELNHD